MSCDTCAANTPSFPLNCTDMFKIICVTTVVAVGAEEHILFKASTRFEIQE